MQATLTFFCGIGFLALFISYFAAEKTKSKLLIGTFLTFAVTAFSIWGIMKFGIEKAIDIAGGSSFTVQIDPKKDAASEEERSVGPDAVQQAIAILDKRLDPQGILNLVIAPQGSDQVLVQMPGVSKEDIDAVRHKIEQVALLEFRMVHPNSSEILDRIKNGGAIEPGWVALPMKDDEFETELLVRRRADLTGKYVSKAGAVFGPNGWEISLSFDSEGSDLFFNLSREHYNERMAIIIDGEIVSAPNFTAPNGIAGGQASISGSFSEMEARGLASTLENPLENPLKIVEERSVTSTYGDATVKQGLYAGIAGLILTLLFVLVYYRFAGLIALIGLTVNVLLIFGALALFEFSLSMSGIAGIILTIGIVIDSNVLIYERLREEMKAGKSLSAAVEASYDRAFSAIFDANVTTLITSVILIALASGTIKGFALTLTIGIFASLFAALLVTRVCFGWLLQGSSLKKLSFANIVPEKAYDVLGKRKLTRIVTVSLILLAILGLAIKRSDFLGVDFKGGDLLTLDVSETGDTVTQEKIQDTLAGFTYINDTSGEPVESALGASYQVQQQSSATSKFIQVTSPFGSGEAVADKLVEQFGELSSSVERVGPKIGNELAKNSGIALVLGLLGILLYVTLRFEFSFALGAIIALVHDIFIVMGLCALFNVEMSLILVGAILTVAGYSINDTIVVFDRIRESLRLEQGTDVRSIMNSAISKTLSRTLLTSLTTLIMVITLYIFGGPSLKDFSFALIIGVILGTFSSLFVAAPIVLWWSNRSNINLRNEVLETEELAADEPGATA